MAAAAIAESWPVAAGRAPNCARAFNCCCMAAASAFMPAKAGVGGCANTPTPGGTAAGAPCRAACGASHDFLRAPPAPAAATPAAGGAGGRASAGADAGGTTKVCFTCMSAAGYRAISSEHGLLHTVRNISRKQQCLRPGHQNHAERAPSLDTKALKARTLGYRPQRLARTVLRSIDVGFITARRGEVAFGR